MDIMSGVWLLSQELLSQWRLLHELHVYMDTSVATLLLNGQAIFALVGQTIC